MRKAFQYRLYPSKAQQSALQRTLEECRWLWNHWLEERRAAYDETGTGVSVYDQRNALPGLKRERPSLARVRSQVLQDVGTRLDRAFDGFFRRVRAGEKPGYPRFRGRGRLMHNHCLAKSICDAGWSQFALVLTSKAAEAGRQAVLVNPAHTSQDCSRCHHRQRMPLCERVYRCPCCGLAMGRDQNAALNILALGQQSLASA